MERSIVDIFSLILFTGDAEVLSFFSGLLDGLLDGLLEMDGPLDRLGTDAGSFESSVLISVVFAVGFLGSSLLTVCAYVLLFLSSIFTGLFSTIAVASVFFYSTLVPATTVSFFLSSVALAAAAFSLMPAIAACGTTTLPESLYLS